MKKKDIVYLVLALLIFTVGGVLAFDYLQPKQDGNTITVEVVQPIQPDFNEEAVDLLEDADKTRDFSVPVDLSTGLSNPNPFDDL